MCRRIFDTSGDEVDTSDKRHPCRSIEVGEVHLVGVEEASDSEDEFISDLS